MKYTSLQLSKLVLQVDPPPCKCPQKKRPFCITPRSPSGCLQRRQERGHCDCPYLPGPPCKHLLNSGLNMTLDQWRILLERACPGEYDDRPVDPEGHIALDRETRVARMAARVAMGYSPFNSKDHIDMPHDLGIRISTLKNGQPVEHDLKIRRFDDEDDSASDSR